jgi:hypothetical protein
MRLRLGPVAGLEWYTCLRFWLTVGQNVARLFAAALGRKVLVQPCWTPLTRRLLSKGLRSKPGRRNPHVHNRPGRKA